MALVLYPDEIAQARWAIVEIRQDADSFDLIASGYTDQNGIRERAFVAEYESAGATWWMEALDPWRYWSNEASNRILKGPPRS